MNYESIWEKILSENNTDNFLILTPNNRLSQFLFKSYSKYIQINNKKIWQSLNIFPFREYIKLLWQDTFDLGLLKNSYSLISEFQKQIIFEKIIDNSFSENLNLLNKKISTKIISAYNLLKDYEVDYSLLDNYKYREVDSFKALINKYESNLSIDNNFIDNYDFIRNLMSLNGSQLKYLIKPRNILLIGFDELSPLVNNFMNFLKSNDYNIDFINPNNNFDIKCKVNNYKFNDKNSELDGIIDYSLNLIKQDDKNLTMIVPNLTAVRNDIIKKFSKSFTNRQDWNVSGGDFLIETPIINSLFILLEFIFNKKTSIELAQEILRRPFYFNENEEYLGKAKVIANLREFNYSNEISLHEFLKYTKDLTPIFNKALNNVIDIISNIKNNNFKFYPSEYAKIIMDSANSIGWPGIIRNISSEEYQAIQSFQNALYEINKLDIILKKIDITEYFITLKNYLNNVEFQIEVNEPKVNILGILEGAGLEFENLWFMSLNSDLWPEEPSPNAFLPNEIQRQFNMPHSSFEREYEFASKITTRILNNSKNITTSFYEYENQKQVYPSSFIENFVNKEYLKNQISSQTKSKSKENNDKLEKYEDYIAPKINRKFIKSAIYALNLQQQCPFRAYAETRLNAKKFQEIKFGITPIDRGNLLHNVMEKIWIHLKSKSGLISFLEKQDSEIKLFIINIINSCLEKLHLEKNLYQDLCNIEKKRLYKIIIKWLEVESQRNNFYVKYTELEQNVKFENIYFTLRIDRIDTEFHNGLENKIIIDYKISSQNTSNWLNNITDIQMPMYYLMLENNKKDNTNNYNGLLYSVINTKEQKFQGYVANDLDFGFGIKNIDFDSYKDSWYEQIKTVANQYLNGLSIKAPVNIDTTCKNCHLKGLCRLYE